MPLEHNVDIIESKQGRNYWWACFDCADEAGPFEMWEQAHDSAIKHGEVL